MRLRDAQDVRRPRLCQLSLFQDAIHLDGKLDLDGSLLGVRVAEIGENIARSCFDLTTLLCHNVLRNPLSRLQAPFDPIDLLPSKSESLVLTCLSSLLDRESH